MITVKNSIRNLILSCLISSLLMPSLQAGRLDSDIITDKITNAISALQASASTRTGGILLAITTAYLAHRGVQKYKRTQAAQPIPNPTEVKLAETVSVKNLFVHGLGGDSGQVCYYQSVLNGDAVSFDFQDTNFSFCRKPSCLGQDADIAKLKAEYDKLVANGHKVNLYGVSRGAATIVAFLGRHQPKNVRCAVLESPFDDVESVVRNQLKNIGIGYIPIVGGIASAAATAACSKIVPALQNYSVYGINPRDCIQHISKDIPLLFIASKKDMLIPASSTLELARAVKKARSSAATRDSRPCASIVTPHGEHANIVNSQSGARLQPLITGFIANPNMPVPVVDWR